MNLRDLFEGSDDNDHANALRQTGFWGRAGAGCIFFAKSTKRFMIAHRSPRFVQEPNTWGTFGGAIDSGENPEAAVRREVAEEAGYSGHFELVPLLVFQSGSFRYSNFVAIVEDEFVPELDWENQGYVWTEFGKWPKPMHPGLVALMKDAASIGVLKKLSKNDNLSETIRSRSVGRGF